MVGVDSSNTKENLLRQVAATAASIRYLLKQQEEIHLRGTRDAPTFLALLKQQKCMDKLRANYGEPDAAYLNARFGKTNTH